MSFDEWWEYQSEIWDAKYKKKVPEQTSPTAFKDLLDILIDVGALEEGANMVRIGTKIFGGRDYG